MGLSGEKKCTRIQRWSNPDVLYGDRPTGNRGNANNARVLNRNACDVASFRGPKQCGGGPDPCWPLFDDFHKGLGALLFSCQAQAVNPKCFDDVCSIDELGAPGPVRDTIASLGLVIDQKLALEPQLGAFTPDEVTAWMRTRPALAPLLGPTPAPLARGGGLARGQLCSLLAAEVTAAGTALRACGTAPTPTPL
jgi:hypothetical protein